MGQNQGSQDRTELKNQVKKKRKKPGIIKWIASSFLWLISPSWASSIWEDWMTEDEKVVEKKQD